MMASSVTLPPLSLRTTLATHLPNSLGDQPPPTPQQLGIPSHIPLPPHSKPRYRPPTLWRRSKGETILRIVPEARPTRMASRCPRCECAGNGLGEGEGARITLEGECALRRSKGVEGEVCAG
jgi:hypothetical protein